VEIFRTNTRLLLSVTKRDTRNSLVTTPCPIIPRQQEFCLAVHTALFPPLSSDTNLRTFPRHVTHILLLFLTLTSSYSPSPFPYYTKFIYFTPSSTRNSVLFITENVADRRRIISEDKTAVAKQSFPFKILLIFVLI
jgi:hypothetical protein